MHGMRMPFVGGVGLPSSGQPQVYCSITKKQAGESPGSGIGVDNRRGNGGVWERSTAGVEPAACGGHK